MGTEELSIARIPSLLVETPLAMQGASANEQGYADPRPVSGIA
nr:MAG TPA: hypothetical protein [Caudoviricetes sp.]